MAASDVEQLSAAFPMMDLSGLMDFSLASEFGASDLGNGIDAEAGVDADGVALDRDDVGVSLGAPVALDGELDGTARGFDAKFQTDDVAGVDGLDSQDGIAIYDEHGYPQVDSFSMAQDATDPSPMWTGEAVLVEAVQPHVPELPATDACLRCTHVRSEMQPDAIVEAVRTAATKLGYVVGPRSEYSTVMCTAMDQETGAPVDFSVQIFTQKSFDDRVIELQSAGRGDRIAFSGVYAQFMFELRKEGICGTVDTDSVSPVAYSSLASPSEGLEQPAPLSISGRASTVGALSIASLGAAPRLATESATSGCSDTSGLSLGTADIAVPGEDGLRLVVNRLRSADRSLSHQSSTGTDSGEIRAIPSSPHVVAEAAEAAASLTLRLHRLSDAKLTEACARMDATALPAALVSVTRTAIATAAAAPSISSGVEASESADQTTKLYAAADDSAVVPAVVALGRVFGCRGTGCSSLTGDAAATDAAISALSSLATAAASQVVAATTILMEDARRGHGLDSTQQQSAPAQGVAGVASEAVSHTHLHQATAALLKEYTAPATTHADGTVTSDYSSSAPVSQDTDAPLTNLSCSGDGPAAMSAAYLRASGSLLRLRVVAAALLAAAQRAGSPPTSTVAPTWAALVEMGAKEGIAALQRAAESTGDRTLGATVSALVAGASM